LGKGGGHIGRKVTFHVVVEVGCEDINGAAIWPSPSVARKYAEEWLRAGLDNVEEEGIDPPFACEDCYVENYSFSVIEIEPPHDDLAAELERQDEER
jgi:hypothetical protein